ncbi:MAG TPA: glycosyltransferase, partial [Cyclobacteriaceae bacterium]|nr:glycosyltransferase [Cyclobacteriaceae bacterium]
MKLIRITTVPMSLQYLLGGQLNFMQAHGFEVLAISADGKEREAILTSGIRHQVIPFTRRITPLQDLLCLWQLIKVFSKEKPDIVHTHTPKAGLLGMLAAFFCRVPVRLHTVAGLPLMEAGGLKRSLLALTEKITYAAAHQVYPNSKGLQNFIQSAFKLNSSKMKMIANGSSNGIDTTYFTAHDALRTAAKAIRIQNGVPAHACVFLFIGRVVRDKGIHELLQ